MALINCPNCGKTVSNKAIRCPHCGQVVNSQTSKQLQTKVEIPEEVTFGAGGRSRKVKLPWVIAIIAVLVAGVLIIDSIIGHSSKRSQDETSKDVEVVVDSVVRDDDYSIGDGEIAEEASEANEPAAVEEVVAVEEPSSYYYVVIGSYSSLSEAQNYLNNSFDMTIGNIYTTVLNGRTLYRVCTGCYPSMSQAQRGLAKEREYFRMRGDDVQPWIWPSRQRERCVYRPIAENDCYLPNFCDLN